MTEVMCTIEESLAKRGMTMKDIEPEIERQKERIRLYKLQEMRQECGATQSAVARHMGVSQKRVSELEHHDVDHTQVGTLQRYVEALGGTLRMSVTLPTMD